ncbi:MAG: DUF2461 domain-containing protein [Sandaracinaceae bacterium]|nr:DUF2461 domain-containing protein [Sandaracinaceae bacterium]
MGEFKGFGTDTLGFLRDLAENNDKRWFEANKARYEAAVREPARALIRDVGDKLGKISPELRADDRKVGGSLMRVHRDVRFGKDKTPYKTNLGIQFRHRAGKDVHAPGAYLHLGLDGCFLAAGMWHPEPAALQKVREAIVADPKRWKQVTTAKKLTEVFHMAGESLARPPRGIDKDHPLIEDLKRKDHMLVSELTLAEAQGPGLVALCLSRLAVAKPHTAFLCAALGLPF